MIAVHAAVTVCMMYTIVAVDGRVVYGYRSSADALCVPEDHMCGTDIYAKSACGEALFNSKTWVCPWIKV